MKPEHSYDRAYFAPYLRRSRVFGSPAGAKPLYYRYWQRWLTRRVPSDARVLEVGCGAGFFVRRIQDRYWTCGADISMPALRIAREQVRAENLCCSAAQVLPFLPSSFHAVFAFDVLEHLPVPADFLAEVFRVLRPGGLFIATTPNPRSLGARLKARGALGEEDRLVSFIYRDRTHVSVWPLETWRAALASAGLRLTKTGTDALWDLPYWRRFQRLQALLFTPAIMATQVFFGYLPWSLGENRILVVVRPERPTHEECAARRRP